MNPWILWKPTTPKSWLIMTYLHPEFGVFFFKTDMPCCDFCGQFDRDDHLSTPRKGCCQVNEKPFEDLKHCTAALTRVWEPQRAPWGDGCVAIVGAGIWVMKQSKNNKTQFCKLWTYSSVCKRWIAIIPFFENFENITQKTWLAEASYEFHWIPPVLCLWIRTWTSQRDSDVRWSQQRR